MELGFHIHYLQMDILLHADDIILLLASVTDLQQMLDICETELNWLDKRLNQHKFVCYRIGPGSNCDGSYIWQRT